MMALLLSGLALAGPVRAEDIVIIAHPSVALTRSIGVGEVAAIYLLRTTVWPDGHPIVPVNREIASDLRRKFTTLVLRQDPGSLAAYWNEMHFRGKFPPLVQESEQSVLAFVERVPGAVGYVSGGIPLPADVHVVARVTVPDGWSPNNGGPP
ncbi:hypothetical protein [Nitrospirillum iridis]|uniref:hypothetical protein n=1 Tax=Nitrospirillum iridis TaxID=765888 RepID=UPI00160C1DAF|nr:hypothetical protein [Nitrospirillum iridis]